MAIRRTNAVKNLAADGFGPSFDTTGRINVYTGAQPATADTAASGTLLGTLALASDAFAAAASGATAINAVTSDSSADASGTAGYCRFYRTGDTVPGSAGNGTTDRRMDLLIGTDISIDNSAVVLGGVIALSAWSYTEG